MGAGWLFWLMSMFLGFGSVLGGSESFSQEAVPDESSGSASGGPSDALEQLYRPGVPDCGFAEEVGPEARPDPGWRCLEGQRKAGLAGRVMTISTADDGRGETIHYVLDEGGTLTVVTQVADDPDLSGNPDLAESVTTSCPAPAPIWRGCD